METIAHFTRRETIVHFTPKSSNEKIGPIPATVSSENTCASDCPLKESGCYAKTGPVSWHWNKVSQGLRGSSWSDLCANISKLKPGQLWRHNVAGDLPGENDLIDPIMLGELVAANMGKKGFTYTHKTTRQENIHWIRSANEWGFTVNLSANNLDHADELADLNAGPVATILPIDAPKKTETPKGRIVIKCPATYRDDAACDTCELCAIPSRKTIIGFPAHGPSKAKAQKVFFMKRG